MSLHQHSSPESDRPPSEGSNRVTWRPSVRLPPVPTPDSDSSDSLLNHPGGDYTQKQDPSLSTSLNSYATPTFEPALRGRQTFRDRIEAGTRKLPTVPFAELPELIFKTGVLSGVCGHMCFVIGKGIGHRLHAVVHGDHLSPLGRTCLIFDSFLFGVGALVLVPSVGIFIESVLKFSSSIVYPLVTRSDKTSASSATNPEIPS